MQKRAEIFTDLRPVLMNLARRMLRSDVEAEDMVQEAYLRWERAAAGEVRSPKAFLTTIVTRLCLNHLKLARVRLEHEDAPLLLDRLSSEARSPAEQAELADALSDAFMFALDDLSPTERAVFLLREGFAFDYGDIASVVDRSEENCRQILRRARERIAAKAFASRSARCQSAKKSKALAKFSGSVPYTSRTKANYWHSFHSMKLTASSRRCARIRSEQRPLLSAKSWRTMREWSP